MNETSENTISLLLEGAARELDLPRDLRRAAERAYRDVGRWMSEHLDDGADWALYPQGSMRIGTVVRPSADEEYDLDSVAVWARDKEAVAKHELKATVGDVLRGFVTASKDNPGGPTGFEEKRRCWTLTYPKPFHLDVLPAIPDVKSPPTGIRLTDKDLTRWLYGDPIAYADWFNGRVALELFERKTALAKEARVDVQDIPDADAPTTLHRVVQVLKIHRDRYFGDDDLRPASIVLTTLAAHAYGGRALLLDALVDVADRLPDFIDRDGGRYVLRNPVQDLENFTDRWTDDHAQQFRYWLDALRRDLDEAAQVKTGLNVLVDRLGAGFGLDVMKKSAEAFGATTTGARQAGALSVAATGVLTRGPGIRVKDHEFHGER